MGRGADAGGDRIKKKKTVKRQIRDIERLLLRVGYEAVCPA